MTTSNALAGNTAKTMSSITLLSLINAARKDAGEAEVRRNDFMSRCRDELDGEHYETFVVKNPNGTSTECLTLNRDQCMLVSMRESKSVRRSVVEKLKELESGVPHLSNPIMNMIVQQAIQYDKLEQQQKELANQLQTATSLISATSNRVEQVAALVGAQDPQYYSIKAYANVLGIRVNDATAVKLGRLASKMSANTGIETGSVKDAVWGRVNSYHQSVLEDAFATLEAR